MPLSSGSRSGLASGAPICTAGCFQILFSLRLSVVLVNSSCVARSPPSAPSASSASPTVFCAYYRFMFVRCSPILINYVLPADKFLWWEETMEPPPRIFCCGAMPTLFSWCHSNSHFCSVRWLVGPFPIVCCVCRPTLHLKSLVIGQVVTNFAGLRNNQTLGIATRSISDCCWSRLVAVLIVKVGVNKRPFLLLVSMQFFVLPHD